MRLFEQVQVLVHIVVAILDGAKESKFLWIFCNFTNVLVRKECFSHFGEVPLFLPPASFEVVLRIREVEIGASFSA